MANGKRLSDAEPTLNERAGAAWRQINLVGLDRRDGGAMGSVSFSRACGQANRAAHRGASRLQRIVIAPKASCAALGRACGVPGRALRRAGRAAAPACVRDAALPGALGCLCGSRWASACGGGDGGQVCPVGRPVLHSDPVTYCAMRAAHDLDGGHAPHEGPRVLARLRVGRRHRQQLARQREPRGLGRRSKQPVVADAL